MQIPLPWERLLWSARSSVSFRVRYVLTDFRLVRIDGPRSDEIAIGDIGDVHQLQSRLGRLVGLSTLVVNRRGAGPPIVLRGVRRGAQLAALLELIADEPRPMMDARAFRAALRWAPGARPVPRGALAGLAVAAAAMLGLAFTLGGSAAAIAYPTDDAIYPGGQKRAHAEIVQFMETDVLPWARRALAPVVGGADRVSCATCHGTGAAARGWRMPSVAALPEPELRRFALLAPPVDSQTRNAIYGYVAHSDKQGKAAYMREVVLPGMAALLHRPPYDFTKTYNYNRTRFALGCYHCHRIS